MGMLNKLYFNYKGNVMEILLIIAVLAFAAWFFFFREKETVGTTAAPYKVETPVALGEPPATVVVAEGAGVVETSAPSVNDQITDAVTQAAAPAKKPRKPRAPKAEKPAAKKAAPKKAAAIKAKPKATKSKKA